MKRLLVLALILAATMSAQPIFSNVPACSTTPPTIGKAGYTCYDTAGTLWVCHPSGACTVAGDWVSQGSSTYTVATLPAAPQTGTLAIVTDGNPGCTVGGGTNRVMCQWTGAAWVAVFEDNVFATTGQFARLGVGVAPHATIPFKVHTGANANVTVFDYTVGGSGMGVVNDAHSDYADFGVVTRSIELFTGAAAGPNASRLFIDSTGNAGFNTAARTGNTAPGKNLVVFGDQAIMSTTTIGSESLTNPNLTAGTSWSATGDGSLAGDAYAYVDGTHAGTLTQANASLAVKLVPYRWYRLTYTISGVGAGSLSGSIVSSACDTSLNCSLSMTAGAGKLLYFKAASTADVAPFTISFVSTATGAFTLDTMSLKELQAGDLAVYGTITGGGTAGIKALANGNVGIGTLVPIYSLDVSRGVGLTGTARFYDATASTGTTLVTITPGAAQTAASVTLANAGSMTNTGTMAVTSTFAWGGGQIGYAACKTAAGLLGYCSDVVSITGTCTCN